MSRKKMTLTPFARLLLVLLVAGPLSYIGASYYNGEDGIENIKKLVGIGQESVEETTTTPPTDSYDLEAENRKLRREVEALKEENSQLRQQLNNQ